MTYDRGYPATINDARAVEIVREAALEVVGPERMISPPPIMAGEDFSYFLLERPGAMFQVGTRNEERGLVLGASPSEVRHRRGVAGDRRGNDGRHRAEVSGARPAGLIGDWAGKADLGMERYMVLEAFKRDIDEIMPGVIADRRYLHEHPELGFQEEQDRAVRD